MKIVSYAGQQLVTTDDVADSLVRLAAAIAAEGESDAVEIPIILKGREDCAELVVGVGNDLLVGPHDDVEGTEPDFSEHSARLQAHRLYPESDADSSDAHLGDAGEWRLDLDLDLDGSGAGRI
ncbi:hypothetical protein [Microbacterium phyllosphaerae]|uniref:hypothetical protein n=1 Tax=Microbacterium phyllosphaerae TaxID=124798 RepID=UPI002167430C|nr:hypothetical protein [Microbacterium phyllosphaerae]MCS3444114.1 hypothetical protein [Microbacterium phyllosphaerae]